MGFAFNGQCCCGGEDGGQSPTCGRYDYNFVGDFASDEVCYKWQRLERPSSPRPTIEKVWTAHNDDCDPAPPFPSWWISTRIQIYQDRWSGIGTNSWHIDDGVGGALRTNGPTNEEIEISAGGPYGVVEFAVRPGLGVLYLFDGALWYAFDFVNQKIYQPRTHEEERFRVDSRYGAAFQKPIPMSAGAFEVHKIKIGSGFHYGRYWDNCGRVRLWINDVEVGRLGWETGANTWANRYRIAWGQPLVLPDDQATVNTAARVSGEQGEHYFLYDDALAAAEVTTAGGLSIQRIRSWYVDATVPNIPSVTRPECYRPPDWWQNYAGPNGAGIEFAPAIPVLKCTVQGAAASEINGSYRLRFTPEVDLSNVGIRAKKRYATAAYATSPTGDPLNPLLPISIAGINHQCGTPMIDPLYAVPKLYWVAIYSGVSGTFLEFNFQFSELPLPGGGQNIRCTARFAIATWIPPVYQFPLVVSYTTAYLGHMFGHSPLVCDWIWGDDIFGTGFTAVIEGEFNEANP